MFGFVCVLMTVVCIHINGRGELCWCSYGSFRWIFNSTGSDGTMMRHYDQFTIGTFVVALVSYTEKNNVKKR